MEQQRGGGQFHPDGGGGDMVGFEDLLDDLGAVLDPQTGHLPAQVRGRVMAQLTTSGGRRPTRWFSPVWRAAAVGGVAVLVAAGVSVVSTMGLGGRAPVASAAAAQVLQRAATAAEQTVADPPRGDQFVFVETMTWSPQPVGGEASGLSRSWRSVDGTHDGLVWTDAPGRDGRTRTVIPGCHDGRASQWGADGTLLDDQTRACRPQPAYQADLPTTPEAMLSYLVGLAGGGDEHERAFDNARTLLQTMYLPPQARSMLLQAVALIPGVTALREVTDATGRPAVAVTRQVHGARYAMVFDPQTYAYRGWNLQPPDGGGPAAGPLRRQAVLRMVIVDTVGQVP